LFLFVIESLQEPQLTKDANEILKIFAENYPTFVLNNVNLQQNTTEGLLIPIIVATLASGKSLVEFCKPIITKISSNINNQSEILRNLKTLQTVFAETHSSNSTTHQLHLVFQELWPLFKRLFDQYSKGDDKILFQICRIIKKAIKILEVEFHAHYLNEFLEYSSRILKENPCAELLYTIEVSVGVFRKVINQEKITEIYLITSQRISSENQPKQFLEDFFGFLFRCAKHIPSIFMSSFEVLDRNFAVLVQNLDTHNLKIFKSMLFFLDFFFKLCSENPQNDHEQRITKIFVEKYGQNITKELVRKLHDQNFKIYIVETVFTSLIYLKRNMLEWLETALQQVQEINDIEKKELLNSLSEIDFSPLHKNNQDPEKEMKRVEIFSKFNKALELLESRLDDN